MDHEALGNAIGVRQQIHRIRGSQTTRLRAVTPFTRRSSQKPPPTVWNSLLDGGGWMVHPLLVEGVGAAGGAATSWLRAQDGVLSQ